MASPKHLRVLIPALVLFFAACGGDKGETETDPAAGEEVPKGAETIDFEKAKEGASVVMFVPAPTEFQMALNAALAGTGTSIDLGTHVKGDPRDLEGKSNALVALETGVRLANVYMTAGTAEKDVTIARMNSAKEALVKLNAGDSVLVTADGVFSLFSEV